MTEHATELTPDEARSILKDILKDGLLGEYDRGFKDGTTLVIEGLKSSIEKLRTMPDAHTHLPGLETALFLAENVTKEVLKMHKEQNTAIATHTGDTKNG